MLEKLIYRVVGAPPASGASRDERLRWIRRFYRLSLAALVAIVIVAIVAGGGFWWILAAVFAVLWAAGLTSISIAIHRESSLER